MDAITKAKQTRRETERTRAQLFEEKIEALKLVKMALKRVLESEDASNAQILEAAELLATLSHPVRW